MSTEYEYDECYCGSETCPECGLECTWCGGDGIGDGCPDDIQCCGQDYCHPCRGTGLRAFQVVF